MKKFRIGIIGTENSHSVAFGKMINLPDENGNYLYPDCYVDLVFGSVDWANKQVALDCNAKVAESVEEMVKNVDAVMITTRDGKFHAEFAKPFIEAGIPAFIDKPFTTDCKEAVELIRLAKEKNVPLCGGSSLKYAENIQELKKIKEDMGEKFRGGFMAAPLNFVNDYSGFWFYSSHLAEMCMETFGYSPKSVVAVENNESVYAIVNYDKFSVTCNFSEHCYFSYSGIVFGEEKSEYRAINLDNVSRLECDGFVEMLRTGKMSHSYEELIAPVFFLDAVKRSYKSGQKVEIRCEEIGDKK